ncbi:MAG: glycosyltransferase [Burkholderiales bacterium]
MSHRHPHSPTVSSTPGTAAPTSVSILIRSMGRTALLQQALDSVAQQSWPAIEVVVVAAIPHHPALPDHCGAFPLRLLTTDQPLPRSTAANRALEAAQGGYVLFLDDDDGLLPDHVEKLARELDRRTDVEAAYSEVQPVSLERVAQGAPFSPPFDPVRLLSGNWMPLHAVMFRHALIERGCRFDPDLDCYEDWDFWLQVAHWTEFARLPGVSAWYRIHESSGVHEHTAFSGPAHVKLYQKWRSRWTAPQLSAIMARVWNHNALTEQLQQVNDALSALQQQHHMLQEQRAILQQQREALQQQHDELQQQHWDLQKQYGSLQWHSDALQHHVDALLHSASWRMTAPFRTLSRHARTLVNLMRPKASRHKQP